MSNAPTPMPQSSTTTGPLPAPAPAAASEAPPPALPATPRRVVGPELAEAQRQLAEMGERLSYLAEDVVCEADLTNASLTDLRGALCAMAAAELKVRQAASLMGAVVTLGVAAPEAKPSPPRRRPRATTRAAAPADADASGADPEDEAEADAAFAAARRSAD